MKKDPYNVTTKTTTAEEVQKTFSAEDILILQHKYGSIERFVQIYNQSEHIFITPLQFLKGKITSRQGANI